MQKDDVCGCGGAWQGDKPEKSKDQPLLEQAQPKSPTRLPDHPKPEQEQPCDTAAQS